MKATLSDIRLEKLYRALQKWDKLRITKTWETKDGDSIRIFNLTDEHINNILNYFNQNEEDSFELYDCYDAIGGDWEG